MIVCMKMEIGNVIPLFINISSSQETNDIKTFTNQPCIRSVRIALNLKNILG
jgi:hypothetical protein